MNHLWQISLFLIVDWVYNSLDTKRINIEVYGFYKEKIIRGHNTIDWRYILSQIFLGYAWLKLEVAFRICIRCLNGYQWYIYGKISLLTVEELSYQLSEYQENNLIRRNCFNKRFQPKELYIMPIMLKARLPMYSKNKMANKSATEWNCLLWKARVTFMQ